MIPEPVSYEEIARETRMSSYYKDVADLQTGRMNALIAENNELRVARNNAQAKARLFESEADHWKRLAAKYASYVSVERRSDIGALELKMLVLEDLVVSGKFDLLQFTVGEMGKSILRKAKELGLVQ